MSLEYDIHNGQFSNVERAAEIVSAELHDNFTAWVRGERTSFMVHFPVGLCANPKDDVQHIAHERFRAAAGLPEAEPVIEVANDKKLFVRHIYSDEQLIHIAYSSDETLIDF